MRTVDPDLISALTSSREIGARMTIRDNRLVFSSRTLAEEVETSRSDMADSCLYGTGFLRVAAAGGELYHQYVPDPLELTYPGWVNTAIVVNPACKPGVEDGRVFFQAGSAFYYVDFDGEEMGAPVEIAIPGVPASETNQYAFAPVGTSGCYVQWGPAADLERSRLAYFTVSEDVEIYGGRVYCSRPVYRLDAVVVDNVHYIYTIEGERGDAIWLSRDGDVWSDIRLVVPLDVVDDISHFAMGGVSVIDGRVFLAGRLEREDYAMDVFTIGPEKHSLGRDMFVTEFFGADLFCKLHKVDDYVFCVGMGGVSEAPATTLVGYDNPDLKLVTSDFSAIEMASRASQPSRLSAEVVSSVSHAALRAGAEITLEGGVADKYAQLGVFGLDVLTPAIEEDGRTLALGGRSAAIRQLDQWVADQNYDYWSQAKQSCNPSELAQVLRASGRWESVNDAIELVNLNTDGFLYMTAKASRGGTMRSIFSKPAADLYTPLYGVGVSFYRETRAEAASRLGIEAGEVSESQFGVNGIFALWGPTEHEDGEGVGLYFWRSGVSTKLASAGLSISDDTWHWLQISHQDGLVRVLYLEDGETDWAEVLAHAFEVDGELPWARERLGRGALFVRNRTPYAQGFGLQSRDMFIPVEDNSVFPMSEVVAIDDERIAYDGKSDNKAGPGPMTVASSETFPGATITNALWVDSVLAQQGDLVGSSELTIGAVNTHLMTGNAHRIRIPMRIDKVRVPLRKVGAPADAYGYIVTDNFDNYGNPASGAILASTSVSPAVVGSTMGWVEFDFGTGPSLAISTNKVPWFFVSMLTPAQLAAQSYPVSGASHYVILVNEEVRDAMGIMRSWGSSGGWKARSPDALVPLRLVGLGTAGSGYEIYLDGADVPTPRDEYNGMALVVISGPGKGAVFQISDYDHQAPDQWVPSKTYNGPDTWHDHVGEAGHGSWQTPDLRRIFVTRDPRGIIGEGSVVEIYPCLYVSERGVDGTTATSHGAGPVSIYRDASVSCQRAEFYSSEVDMRLEDMADELAAKAGVLRRSYARAMEGTKSFDGPGWGEPLWLDDHRNFILRLKAPVLSTEMVSVLFRCDDDYSDVDNIEEGYRIDLADGALHFSRCDGTWSELEVVPVSHGTHGWVTVSVQKSTFSVWIGGRLVHSFEDTLHAAGAFAGVVGYGDVDFDVEWSKLDHFIDNYILDMGARGAQLLNRLIGAKRVVYMDDQNGGLWMDLLATGGAAQYSCPPLGFSIMRSNLDIDRVSRVRAEGTDIAEIVDFERLREDGNLFALVNAREANDAWQVLKEAYAVMRDAVSSATTAAINTAADPRVEPNDVVEFPTPEGNETVVVDGVTYRLVQTENSAAFDMRLEVRRAL